MLKVGITGGIGSGKSTAAEVFEKLMVPVFYADNEAKALYTESSEVKRKIIKLLGKETYLPSGQPNRPVIASKIFNNEELLHKVNQIIHPAVAEKFKSFCHLHSKKHYVIKEAAILFESNAHKDLDYTICVDAPEDIRIKRVMQRDKITEEDVRQRIKNQWPAEKKAALADFVVLNDGKTMLLPQIIRLHEQFNDK